jgi:hypothetical protein
LTLLILNEWWDVTLDVVQMMMFMIMMMLMMMIMMMMMTHVSISLQLSFYHHHHRYHEIGSTTYLFDDNTIQQYGMDFGIVSIVIEVSYRHINNANIYSTICCHT